MTEAVFPTKHEVTLVVDPATQAITLQQAASQIVVGSGSGPAGPPGAAGSSKA